jgi:hypothetical protein
VAQPDRTTADKKIAKITPLGGHLKIFPDFIAFSRIQDVFGWL